MSEQVKEVNIILAGVGGQGTILLSEILGNAAILEGLKVRGSEILGMAQRGGSVITVVRLGSEALPPLVPEGKGTVLIGMEPSEALRNIRYLARGGTAIVNVRPIVPPSVFLGLSKYGNVNDVMDRIKQVAGKLITLDAVNLAEKAGSALTANVVMLGALIGTGEVPIKPETIKKVLSERFSGKILDMNIKAFELGMETCAKRIR